MPTEAQINPMTPSNDPLSMHKSLRAAISDAVKTATNRAKVAGFDKDKAAATAEKCAILDFYYARLQDAYTSASDMHPMAAPALEAPIVRFDYALRNGIAPADAFTSAIADIEFITNTYNSATIAALPVDKVAIAAKATETAAKDPSVDKAATEAEDPSVDKAATKAQDYFKVFLDKRMKMVRESIKCKTPQESNEIERTHIDQIKVSLLKVIEHMIDTKCDLNALLFLKLPILHHAIIYNLAEAVQKLLGKGASPDAQNFYGQTAWDIARDQGYAGILKVLGGYSMPRSDDTDTTSAIDATLLANTPTPQDTIVECTGADCALTNESI